MIHIGVVGGGFGAAFQWHLHPHCRVAAVCDVEEAGRKQLQQTYRCDSVYADFRELLGHPNLDAVAVFTPAPLHAEMSIQAMEAGKHVLSAVPAAMTLDECSLLLECVKRTGMTYMMAETSYFRQPIITCREMAAAGEFGTIFYSEAEYHHEGLIGLMYDRVGRPTWRHGLPPMLYPTHCTGMIVPVMGERLTEVQAVGCGDGHEILRTNRYGNPFWNETAFFKTSGGHSCRIAVWWHVAAGEVERGQFYGDRASYLMERREGSPNTLVRIGKQGRTELDENGYPAGDIEIEAHQMPDYLARLPEPLRVKSGHGNSHTFLTHEFASALVEERRPAIDIYEALGYTVPGIVAHESAMRDGERRVIPSFDPAHR